MIRLSALLLTVLTGFSGLVYEVTWQRYLATLLGSHSEATAAVLAIFLGGLSAGYALFGVSLVLLASGFLLLRLDFFAVKDPLVRAGLYWAHVAAPLLLVWLFILHRLAGKRIRWEVGRRWAIVAGIFGAVMLVWQAQDPRSWNVEGPASGEQYFFPSLARTATGDFIPERVLMNDEYCKECHEDSHRSWAVSAHRFSSFNNPAYKFSVDETRRVAFERDGDVQALSLIHI